MATYTWATFKAAVLSFVTDRTPAETNFTAAVTEFVAARIARDLIGDANGYAVRQNRFTAMRRGLAGFQTTQNDATLKAAVRVLLSEGARTNTQVAKACALYIRAETAIEVEARGEAGPEAAIAISKQCRAEYQALRARLCGFNHTLGSGLTAEVAKYLPVDSQRLNFTTYIATLQAAAVEDIQAFGTWLDQQILTAKDDLQALNDRVQKELRAGAIDLQERIAAFQVGHTTTIAEVDVTVEGQGCTGSIPDDAQVREAWIVYPEDTDLDPDIIQDLERKCEIISWDERREKLLYGNTCAPRIAIDPKGVEFALTPQLKDDITLRLVYDGTKLNFADGDDVPFDEQAVRAVGIWINAAMALEWGDSAQQQSIHRADYTGTRTGIYLRLKDRATIVSSQ